jgi:hypothetical protein
MTKARKRKRVHRVARGKPKPGHIAAHNRRRRKGEILCHNHVLHTAATANGVHGFRWFTVCAPAGWDPASQEWEVCPCGWRPELGKHYAKISHVQWWREQIKERGSLAAVYREVRRRQREYRDTDVGYQRRPQRALPPPHPLLLSNGATADSFQVTGGRS